MNVIMIQLADSRRFAALLAALRDAGAHGATIYDNPGMELLFWHGVRSALAAARPSRPRDGKCVLAFAPTAAMPTLLEAAERVLGGAHAGLICSWPVDQVESYQGDARAGELVGGRA